MARLIDASVFIELERRGELIEALDRMVSGEPFALGSITASELLFGVHRTVTDLQRQRRSEFVETVLSRVPVLPFDLEAARTLARISAELTITGQSIGTFDLIVAATALARDYDVVTHNLRHFERIPGLVVHHPRG